MTRSEDPPRRLSDALRRLGALPIRVPLTSTLPPSDPEALDRALGKLAEYDWLVVTSARTVQPLSRALRRAGIDPAGLPDRGVHVCAVGPRTGEALAAAGLAPELVPSRFLAEGVVEAMLGEGVGEGVRVLLPRAEEGRDTIPRLLTEAGAEVTVVSVYRTEPSPHEGDRLARMVAEGEVDVLTFTAGSAAQVFADAWSRRSPGGGGAEPRAIPGTIGVVALGPATATVLERAGLRVDRVAHPHTFEGLVAAVAEWEEGRAGPEEGFGTTSRE